MILYRKVPFLTFVLNPYRKVKINLAGCNFNCKGCFAIAKEEVGRLFSVENLLNLLIKSCQFIYPVRSPSRIRDSSCLWRLTSNGVYGDIPPDVQMTGGEPTLNSDYLLTLIQGLRKLSVEKVGISTNGYLVDRNLVKELKSLGVNYIKLDLKAYSEKIHRWYTGESNRNVLKAVELLDEYGLNFYVRTILMPGIVDFEEIERIAKFLNQVNKNITYKIYQFAPEQLDKKVSRSPTNKEMRKAYSIAKIYLDNVEFYTTETAYKPDPYKYIEVRADELLERFEQIDRISKSVINQWEMQYFRMNQILASR